MIHYIAWLLIAILPFSANAQITEMTLTNLTILADRALTVPLSKLASDYSRDHNITITVAFAPSFEQTVRIQEGAAADLFISAHPQAIRQLKQRGLFDVTSLMNITRANLVLIEKNSLNIKGSSFKERLASKGDFLAIASPAATAEGFYANQVLAKAKGENPQLAEMPDTETIFYQLAKHNRSAKAIAFEVDAKLSHPQHSIITTIPNEWHEPAVFTSAVIPGGNMTSAREFQKHLISEKAQKVFGAYGFSAIKKAEKITTLNNE